MTALKITWVYEPHDSPRYHLGRDQRFVDAIARHAGVDIPLLEGRLADLAPPDGFILLNSSDPGTALRACPPEQRAELAPRLVPLDVSQSRIYQRILDGLGVAAAVDSFAHGGWTNSTPGEHGLYGLRAVAAAIGATCTADGSEGYCYLSGPPARELPQLIADYLRALHARRTSAATFDFSRIRLGEALRSGSGDQVLAANDDGRSLLVTVTAGHAVDPATQRDAYRLDFAGVTPLVWLGRVADQRFDDALVEQLPAGRPASEHEKLDEHALTRLGAELAGVLARVHEAGLVLDGLQPDLIYVTDDGTLSALAPRGPRFIASSKPVVTGPRSYPVPYLDRDSLILGRPTTQSTDVFALCASLFVLGTGRHPFGSLDSLQQLFAQAATGDCEPWPGGGAFGALLARGLNPAPASRPAAAELADAFAALAG